MARVRQRSVRAEPAMLTRDLLDAPTGRTLADVRVRVRAALPSVFKWPDATLDGWILDAIREYSGYLPRLWRHELALTTGTQVYDVPSDNGALSLESVEYPAGETPPEFLARSEEWSAAWLRGERVYALRGVATTTLLDEDVAQGQIVFCETVATGETAALNLRGLHTLPALDTDQVSVPPAHWRAILAYCVARAWDDLSLQEGLTLGAEGKGLAAASKTASEAWARYEAILADLVQTATLGRATSAVVAWSGVGL